MNLKCLLSCFAVGFAFSAGFNLDKNVEFLTLDIHNNEINKIEDKVDVRLYYECWCPYCRDFYMDTLNKTVAKLASYINLKTYPYGNAKRREVNGKPVIKCQHGPEECYGNKLHACAIDLLKNTTQYVYYVSCMMEGVGLGSPGSTDADAIKCGELMGIDAKHIIKCAKGKRGEELLEYYGKETDKDVPNKKGVPWPLVNGKHYDGILEFDQFYAKICDTLKHPPPQCNRL